MIIIKNDGKKKKTILHQTHCKKKENDDCYQIDLHIKIYFIKKIKINIFSTKWFAWHNYA